MGDGGVGLVSQETKRCKTGKIKLEQPQYRSPGSKKALPKYTCVPIIAPPQNFISTQKTQWQLAIHQYKQKRAAVLGKAVSEKVDRIYYNGSREKLTKAEMALMLKFIRSKEHKELFELVTGLYDKAFKFDKSQRKITVDSPARKTLSALLNLVQKEGIGETWVRYYARLSNPDLHQDDLALLMALEKGGKIWAKISARLGQLAVNKIAAYGKSKGTIDTERSVFNKRLQAIKWVLNLMGKFDLKADRVINRVLHNATKHILKYFPEGRKAVQEYRKARARYLRNPSKATKKILKKAKQKVYEALLKLEQEFAVAPYRSDNRVSLYKLKTALYYASIASGIPQREIEIICLESSLPLPKDPKRRAEFVSGLISADFIFGKIIKSPEKIDNLLGKRLYIKTLQQAVASYLACKDHEGCESWGAYLGGLIGFQEDMGLSRGQLDRILSPLSVRPSNRKITVAELGKINKPTSLRPQDLPDAVVGRLKITGQWGSVCLVRRITFIPSIHQSKLAQGSIPAEGYASLAGIITINSSTFRSPEEIALVLTHEARHIQDFNSNPKISSTQTERNAYLTDYKAGQKILVSMIQNRAPRERIEKIAYQLAVSRANVEYANRVLGYPGNDFSERSDLPKGPNMDYSYYPIFQGYRMDPPVEVDSLLGTKMAGIFKQVLLGKLTLSGNITLVKNKNGEYSMKEVAASNDPQRKIVTLFKALDRLDNNILPNSLRTTRMVRDNYYTWHLGRDEARNLLRFFRLKRLARKEIHVARGKVLIKKDKPLIPIPF